MTDYYEIIYELVNKSMASITELKNRYYRVPVWKFIIISKKKKIAYTKFDLSYPQTTTT